MFKAILGNIFTPKTAQPLDLPEFSDPKTDWGIVAAGAIGVFALIAVFYFLTKAK